MKLQQPLSRRELFFSALGRSTSGFGAGFGLSGIITRGQHDLIPAIALSFMVFVALVYLHKLHEDALVAEEEEQWREYQKHHSWEEFAHPTSLRH